MALISAESVERVKGAADIVEVISAHTDLRRQGARWVGLCPFHDERTPSFSVEPTEKLYHCFGCGVGGDVIKFVEEKDGLGFAEAVELLADRYGVELEREQEDPRAEAKRQNSSNAWHQEGDNSADPPPARSSDTKFIARVALFPPWG